MADRCALQKLESDQRRINAKARIGSIRLPNRPTLQDRSGATRVEHWFVYILRCADGTLYTGVTLDLDRRCRQHNAGTASRYTRSRLPTMLIYREQQNGRGAALKREVAIKRLRRPEKLALIFQSVRAA